MRRLGDVRYVGMILGLAAAMGCAATRPPGTSGLPDPPVALEPGPPTAGGTSPNHPALSPVPPRPLPPLPPPPVRLERVASAQAQPPGVGRG